METVTFAGVIGAIFGSFLNVVAYRMPRRESLVRPASRCTSCGTSIRPYDNIPVLSWLLLRGRCRSCSAPISVSHPLIVALGLPSFASADIQAAFFAAWSVPLASGLALALYAPGRLAALVHRGEALGRPREHLVPALGDER
jgi:leader peptidase (prepilin peptidase)/N-methyltransferase